MHLELLVEDRSGGLILASLVRSVLAAYPTGGNWEFSLRPHRGAGGIQFNWREKPTPHASSLLKLLPAKMRAYAKVFDPRTQILVVVMDSDTHPVADLVNPISNMSRMFAAPLPVVIGIAVEELESWVLADWKAIQQAYPEADRKIYDTYEQDSVCGTWEQLCRVVIPGAHAEQVIRLGYPAVGQYKHEWAQTIAPHLDASRNRSPSFRLFRKKLLQAMKDMEQGYGRESSRG